MEKWVFSWCLDNKWHRIGKPAIICSNGDVWYYEDEEDKMRKFSIRIFRNLIICYNHYLSDKFIKEKKYYDDYFKEKYPLEYSSRGFDKPAKKWRNGSCIWKLDNKWHRVGKPAIIRSNGDVEYWENGWRVE